jgi:transcriptional regulator with XRE-family HTH domain
MEILQRIKRLIDAKGLNTNAFALRIGIAQTTLSTYFTKNRYPAYETLHAILHTFPDVSAEWLMRGEGDMFICDGLPVFRGDESESEEDLHAALAQCRAKLEDSQNENVKLLGQLEFMEEYNLKVVGRLNAALKKVDELSGVKGKKDIG